MRRFSGADSRVDDAHEVELVDARRHRERDAEVARGRLDNRRAGRDRAVAQAAFDDVARRSILDRAAWISSSSLAYTCGPRPNSRRSRTSGVPPMHSMIDAETMLVPVPLCRCGRPSPWATRRPQLTVRQPLDKPRTTRLWLPAKTACARSSNGQRKQSGDPHALSRVRHQAGGAVFFRCPSFLRGDVIACVPDRKFPGEYWPFKPEIRVRVPSGVLKFHSVVIDFRICM